MKFSIDKADFLVALNKVKPFSARTSLTITECVRICADDGIVELNCNNLKSSCTTSAIAECDDSGDAVVNVGRLTKIISEMPDGPVIVTCGETQQLHILSGHIDTTLFSMNPDEFPPVAGIYDPVNFALPKDALANMVQDVAYAVCTDQCRMNLCGVFIESNDGHITLAATDGKRCAISRGDISAPDFSCTVPLLPLREALRIDGDEIRVAVSKDRIVFEGEKTIVSAQLIDGGFPELDRVIPTKNTWEATIDVAALSSALRRASLIATGAVDIVFFADEVSIQGRGLDVGSFEELVTGQSPGGFEITLNPEYLLDALSALESETVTLELKDALSPVLIRDGGYTAVVMPVRR